MINKPISATRIDTFLQCAFKYYLRYVEKIPTDSKAPPLTFGNAIHLALETLYIEVFTHKAKVDAALYDHILKVFTKEAIRGGLPYGELYDEAETIIRRRIDSVDTSQNVVGVEIEFEVKTPKGTPLIGKIDKVIELDPTTVLIVDYKTSRVAKTQEEVDNDLQISMYDYAISVLYPQYSTIVSALDFVRIGEVYTHRTAEQRKRFVLFVDEIYEAMSMLTREAAVPTVNKYCNNCDYRYHCPAYEKLTQSPMAVEHPSLLTNEELTEELDKVNFLSKMLDSYQRDIKDVIYQRIMNDENLSSSNKKIAYTQRSNRKYDPKVVYDVIGPDKFLRVVNVSTTALDSYLKDNPEESSKLKDTALTSYYAPSFSVKSIKNKK